MRATMADVTSPTTENVVVEELEMAELPDSALEEIVGGVIIRKMKRCPYCGSKSVVYRYSTNGSVTNYWKCRICQKTF